MRHGVLSHVESFRVSHAKYRSEACILTAYNHFPWKMSGSGNEKIRALAPSPPQAAESALNPIPGMVYVVSLLGTTGMRDQEEAEVKRARVAECRRRLPALG